MGQFKLYGKPGVNSYICPIQLWPGAICAMPCVLLYFYLDLLTKYQKEFRDLLLGKIG